MQPIYIPADPLQALLVELSRLFCSISSGGHCISPM